MNDTPIFRNPQLPTETNQAPHPPPNQTEMKREIKFSQVNSDSTNKLKQHIANITI